jgi:hypothetical protein
MQLWIELAKANQFLKFSKTNKLQFLVAIRCSFSRTAIFIAFLNYEYKATHTVTIDKQSIFSILRNPRKHRSPGKPSDNIDIFIPTAQPHKPHNLLSTAKRIKPLPKFPSALSTQLSMHLLTLSKMTFSRQKHAPLLLAFNEVSIPGVEVVKGQLKEVIDGMWGKGEMVQIEGEIVFGRFGVREKEFVLVIGVVRKLEEEEMELLKWHLAMIKGLLKYGVGTGA